MALRSISNEEIALIKAMLQRKMKNKDIQFYFNRPDRPVNSGRITDIASGKYGVSAKIPAAADSDLAEFMSKATSSSTSSPMATATVQSMFAKGKSSQWHFIHGESDQHECKESFGFKHSGQWLKAIAALANNRGGYIFFGVKDKNADTVADTENSNVVVGMNSSEFGKADPADFTKKLKATFDPTPRIQTKIISVGGKPIGVIFVEQHESRPVIAVRNEGDHVKEGDIFFRYPGQSARIKYSDLRTMLDQRDRHARRQVLPLVDKLLSLGPDRAMIADLDAGELSDGRNSITIDEQLLKSISFIRDGEFSETEGSPTLRLIGTVRAQGSGNNSLRKGILTKTDLMQHFLKQETPFDASEYVRFAVEGCQGAWVPIHYFARVAKLSNVALQSLIKSTAASKARKKTFLDRVSGKVSAFQKPTGSPLAVLEKLNSDMPPEIKTLKDAANVAAAIKGIPNKQIITLQAALSLLAACMEMAKGDDATTSIVRRGICRVDELFFAEA
jgi:hypothetical protein